MNSNPKLSYTIAAILAASGARVGVAATAPESDSIEEITVTAQRRSENAQNVPITIQALTSESLSELSITTLEDYVKYLPNVTALGNGPGQNNIFMRGLASGTQSVTESGGVTGIYPNVAIYLDDQSGQLPVRNLDVYAADLERIEVLEGPQGTLFGAGAQAGVVRYITNKPKLDAFGGSASAGYGITAHGDPNTDLNAVVNIPLITDTFAVRAVIYNERRGGYIDNVPGTFTRKDTDIGIHYANNPGGGVPPNSEAINNSALVARAINPVNYQGIRVQGLYKINDDWDVLLAQSYQDMHSEGVFYQYPKSSDGLPLEPLQVTVFNPSFDKDKFENTAWTVNGKLGPLKAVYTGAYLDRNVDQVGDYTNYARGVYADYYQCYGAGPGRPNSVCYTPRTSYEELERNTHLSNEFRLSTPDDWRLRGIAGVFHEDNKIYDQTVWEYKTIPPCTSNATPGTAGNGNTGCLSNPGTAPGATVENPGVAGDNVSFFEDTRRDVKQIAFFGSLDFDLIPKVLTLTAGTRHFKFDNSFVGSTTSSFGCFQKGVSDTGCTGASNNLDARNLKDTESGFKSRANLTYHVTPDIMVYYTWSQGFRPGAFNRTSDCHIPGPDLVNQFCLPQSYHSDSLTNNELGWKTEFLDKRVQWNGAIYQENWDDVQLLFLNPGATGNLVFTTNGQNYRIRGLETSIIALVAHGLSVQGGGSWNHSEQTNSPALTANNPASVNFGNPVTQNCKNVAGTVACNPITDVYGPPGTPTANSPPLQFNFRVRYEWNIGNYGAFVQAGATHTGHSFTQGGATPATAPAGTINPLLRFENPAYSTFEASTGVSKDAWNVVFYGQNLSNSNASVFNNSGQYIVTQTVLRPRVLGVRFGYRF